MGPLIDRNCQFLQVMMPPILCRVESELHASLLLEDARRHHRCHVVWSFSFTLVRFVRKSALGIANQCVPGMFE